MAFLDEPTVRQRARDFARRKGRSPEEALKQVSRRRASRYDIFLSQTIRDAEIVLGVYVVLGQLGYQVFCDWIAEPQSDRSAVTPAHAEAIRAIMNVSDSLIFLDTENAEQSRWMCWELGWFDGCRGPVGVLPVLAKGTKSYRGREFLGLYPYLELNNLGELKVVRPIVTSPSGILIIESPNSIDFKSWRDRSDDFMRPRVVNW